MGSASTLFNVPGSARGSSASRPKGSPESILTDLPVSLLQGPQVSFALRAISCLHLAPPCKLKPSCPLCSGSFPEIYNTIRALDNTIPGAPGVLLTLRTKLDFFFFYDQYKGKHRRWGQRPDDWTQEWADKMVNLFYFIGTQILFHINTSGIS